MYKNRYFKTTFGVPTELAFGGNTLPTGNTGQATLDFSSFTGVAGVIYPVRIMPNLKDRKILQNSIGWNVFTTGPINAGTTPNINVNSQYIQFASCVTAGTALTGSFQMTTPLLANSIRVIGSEAYAAATAQVSTLLLNGTYTIGHKAILKVIETTPGNQNLPVWDYEWDVVTGTASTDLLTAFVAAHVTGKPTGASTVMSTTRQDEWFYFSGAGSTITVTAAAGATGRSFKLAFTVQTSSANPTASAWTTPTYTLSIAPSYGYGTPDQVSNLIQEDATRRGVGHYYPEQGATASEFGTPDASILAVTSATPTVITLQGLKYEASPTPLEQHNNPNHYLTILCGPTVAASILLQFPAL